MPLCGFGDARMRSDHTLVENAFIREHMAAAPGDAVKVYLYGLMQCQQGAGASTMAAFAREIGLSEEDVRDAFAYWERCGLVTLPAGQDNTVLYLSARHAMPLEQTVYTNASYHDRLLNLFSPRQLSANDFMRIHDWTDQFGIEEEAVIMMIAFGRSRMSDVSRATPSRQLSYIEKIARQWADEGIRTVAAAEAWLKEQDCRKTGLGTLLSRLGIRRNPTAAERALYESWLEKGFSQDAILIAAERTTGVRNPSLQTVDGVLTNLARQGAMTARQIRAENSETLCREALIALKLPNSVPTASQLEAYRSWAAAGYDHEHILTACEMNALPGRQTIRDVAQTLNRWQHLGLKDMAAIRAHEKERSRTIAAVEQLFEAMAIARRVGEADIADYRMWTVDRGLSEELIRFAAESAHGAVSPYRMMRSLLEQWQAAGINTVPAARAALQERAVPRASGAQNPALKYDQREVSKDEGIEWL
ncbi:MAG: DnaD domain protein [Clostridia bacterium]|nr:DnaD domain protein [Clostridia bacterium]